MKNTMYTNIIPPPLENTKILGPIAQNMERFAEQRMLSDEAVNVVYKEAHDAFIHKVDDESGVIGIWQGEFWGKLVISACRYAHYSQNAKLKELIREKTLQLIQLQDEDGYLGTYKNSSFVLPADREAAQKVIGWMCNWNWNIWCRKYTLWGLLEAFLLTHEQPILDAAKKLADHLIKQLKDNNIRIQDTGTFGGLPSCSIIKPMLILHSLVPDRKYLDFAIQCAEAFDDDTGRSPNLIANARTGKPVHQWYPKSETWAKAYEMMSVLDGFCQLTRVTGNEKYLQAAATIRDLLEKYELNAVMSVGYNDIFAHAASQINTISEPCDHIHWMRLNYELYTLTGDIRYVDSFEACYLNAFQAAVYRDGKWGSRGVRSHGRHYAVSEQAKFTHNHCCVNNLPRGYFNAAQLAVMQQDDALIVNLYTPFKATMNLPSGTFQVTIGGDYQTAGKVVVDIHSCAQKPVNVSFRIPSWSGKTTVTCPASVSTMPAGTYCLLSVPPNKTTRFTLQFDMTPVIRPFPRPVMNVPQEDWKARRWTCQENKLSSTPYDIMLQSPKCTIAVGPTLLARSKYIGNTEEEMFGNQTLNPKDTTLKLQPVKPTNTTLEFEATFTGNGRTFTTRVCDYGSAANEILPDDRFFSMFF